MPTGRINQNSEIGAVQNSEVGATYEEISLNAQVQNQQVSGVARESEMAFGTQTPNGEVDPLYNASEAAKLVPGDKARIDNAIQGETGDQSEASPKRMKYDGMLGCYLIKDV